MKIKINITPMSMGNGVLGLPIKCCRDWKADPVKALFVYAGKTSDITISPKHIKKDNSNTASAWQFTVNDSIQFNQLRMDGVHTYAEGKMMGEKLVCDISEQNNICVIEVTDTEKKEDTPATKKIKELLTQGYCEKSDKESTAPLWNSPSAWIDYSRINDYDEVKYCIYIWQGEKKGHPTKYLYVGIVGDTNREGITKRSLTSRLKEENKKFVKELDVTISRFRYCSLNDARGYSISDLLRTVEMAEITVLSSLFKCENARDNIDAIFGDADVVLLNKMTSFMYIQ